jgi:hypothetical protein
VKRVDRFKEGDRGGIVEREREREREVGKREGNGLKERGQSRKR